MKKKKRVNTKKTETAQEAYLRELQDNPALLEVLRKILEQKPAPSAPPQQELRPFVYPSQGCGGCPCCQHYLRPWWSNPFHTWC